MLDVDHGLFSVVASVTRSNKTLQNEDPFYVPSFEMDYFE
jgi:hypothetical protein